MNKRTIAKRIIQGAAIAFGLLALLLVSGVFLVAVPAIMSPDWPILIEIPLPLLCGGICIAIAWQNLRHFGPNAIKNVICLVSLVLWGILTSLEWRLESTMAGRRIPFVDMAIHLIPLLVAIVFYCVVSKKLIQVTEPPSTLPEANPVSAETASNEP